LNSYSGVDGGAEARRRQSDTERPKREEGLRQAQKRESQRRKQDEPLERSAELGRLAMLALDEQKLTRKKSMNRIRKNVVYVSSNGNNHNSGKPKTSDPTIAETNRKDKSQFCQLADNSKVVKLLSLSQRLTKAIKNRNMRLVADLASEIYGESF